MEKEDGDGSMENESQKAMEASNVNGNITK